MLWGEECASYWSLLAENQARLNRYVDPNLAIIDPDFIPLVSNLLFHSSKDGILQKS